MKISLTGLCLLGFAFYGNVAQAQCGCSSGSWVSEMSTTSVVPMTFATPVSAMPTRTNSALPASGISYVNKLSTPLDRGSYRLCYALHMNNGQLLYSDFLPQGFSVAGTEVGRNGRRMKADLRTDGMVNVNDPATRQVIAVIPR